MAFTTKYKSMPVVRFKLTEGQICADPEQYMASDGRKLYPLLNTGSYGACSTMVASSYYDDRYDFVGSVNEVRLFEDNGVMNVIQNLPEYPIHDSYRYDWSLYSNEYNYWNPKCESDDDLDREAMLELLADSLSVTR